MSTLFVDTINEKTSGNGVAIPGHVVQVQHATLAGGGDSTTSTSYIDQGLTVSITPKHANSIIMVMFSFATKIDRGTSHTRADFRLIESGDSTVIWDERYVGRENIVDNGDPIQNWSGAGVYTCSETSQKTFKIQTRKAAGNAAEAGNIYYKWYTSATHTIQALEIAQ